MAAYPILYWQDVPVQVRAEDDGDEVTLALDGRFLRRVDQLAAERGLQAADDYLAQWHWSEPASRPGTAAEVAAALKSELEAAG